MFDGKVINPDHLTATYVRGFIPKECSMTLYAFVSAFINFFIGGSAGVEAWFSFALIALVWFATATPGAILIWSPILLGVLNEMFLRSAFIRRLAGPVLGALMGAAVIWVCLPLAFVVGVMALVIYEIVTFSRLWYRWYRAR